MDVLSALFLGIVQGLTEFLPVSSTGHLIIARDILGLPVDGGLAVDAVLHLATAGAVIIYFRKDILKLLLGIVRREREQLILGGALLIGTIPAVIFGLLFAETIEYTLRGTLVVAGGLVAGSFIFWIAEKLGKAQSEFTILKGLGVGFFQVLALIPGMSRSGMTISGGLLLGLSREAATRFAFLLSFPVILGAGGTKLFSLYETGLLGAELVPITTAAVAAFVSGLFAIHFMVRFLKTHSLMPFVWYRLGLALVIVIVALI